MIEGIKVRFEKGRIVEAHASRGEEVLRKLIDTDDGARRLGEGDVRRPATYLDLLRELAQAETFVERWPGQAPVEQHPPR